MASTQNGKHADPDVQGYCVHCRSHRPMLGAIQVSNRRGGRDLKGHCGVCGRSMYRLGGWDSVVAAAQKALTNAAAQTAEPTPDKEPASDDR